MAEFKPLTKNKKSVPICPNHGEPLEGIGHPIPSKGTGMCPVSGCSFDFEISLEQADMRYEKDHNGNIVQVPVYKLIGEEN